jgi:hypothetical protein
MMHNLAVKTGFCQTILEQGRIVAKKDSGYEVETEIRSATVRRAVSCLVEPRIDDLVLIALTDAGNGHILAILEREDDEGHTETTLAFDADLRIKTSAGRISLTAPDGLDLAGENDIRLLSSRLDITAAESRVDIKHLSFWGALFEGRIDVVTFLADRFESFMKRFSRITRQSYRQVDETDQLRCGRLNYRADKSLQLRGQFAQMTAQEDIHIDGERINIG